MLKDKRNILPAKCANTQSGREEIVEVTPWRYLHPASRLDSKKSWRTNRRGSEHVCGGPRGWGEVINSSLTHLVVGRGKKKKKR